MTNQSERKELIKNNYTQLLSEIAVEKLLAVTKYSPFTDIEILYSLGQRHFGESRVQDLKEKAHLASEAGMHDVCWHFIGHLQTNKIKDLIKISNLYAIHSIDAAKQLDELKKREELFASDIKFFIQVNTSGEEQKAGVINLAEIEALYNRFIQLSFHHLHCIGLMTIGKIRTDNFEQDAKKSFAQLKELQQQLTEWSECQLSMGMSADYKWALEYGADWVRIGSRLFN